MKHPTSRALHTYWDRLRGERTAPERSEIEPGEIRHLLADSLILEMDLPMRAAHLRLAGTRVCALFGRELRGLPFGALWEPDPARAGPAHAESWRILEVVAGDGVGTVMGLRGHTAVGEGLDLELLLLPLRHRGRTHARMLGTLSPLTVPPWIGLRPLARLETVSLRILGRGDGFGSGFGTAAGLPPDAVPPAPANDAAPVRRGHLLVHRGGRP